MASNLLDSEVPVVPPMGRKRIEAKTELFLQKNFPEAMGGDAPVDIEHLFEIVLPGCIEGLYTGYVDLSSFGYGLMGYTSAKHKVCFVDSTLYKLATEENAREADVRRFRSTVSHEIAHAVCHYPYLKVFESYNTSGLNSGLMRIEKRKDIRAFEDPEWQAWEMAGGLLMPKSRVIRDLLAGKNKYELAEIYNVNPAFAQKRIDSIMKQQ